MDVAAAALAAIIATLFPVASYYYYYYFYYCCCYHHDCPSLLPLLQQSFMIPCSSAAAAAAVIVAVIIIITTIGWRRRRRMLMRWKGKGKGKGKGLMKKRWSWPWSWSSEEEDDDDDDDEGVGGVFPEGSQGLPVVGETLRLISAYKTEDPEPFIDERVRRYGSRIFSSHVFGERTVFSADAELNRVVLGGEGKTFEGSYPSSISTLLGTYSLVLMKGALHKRMHSLTLTRFSSLSILRHSLLPHIDRLIRHTLTHSWLPPPQQGQGQGHTHILLLDQAKKITFDLTVKQLISYDPGDWTESLRTHYLLLIDGFFSLPFPFPSSLFSFTTYGRAIQARKKVAEKLIQVVRKRKEEKMKNKNNMGEIVVPPTTTTSSSSSSSTTSSSNNNNNNKKKTKKKADDMLDELLEAEEGFTEEVIVDFLLALLVAGYETTPTIMTLAVKFLTETPAALALLKEEHDEIRARKEHESEPLEWSDYKAMHFTQCVINETLRVANIISGVFRRATADIYFKGYKIPKGCKVFASFRAVHLDPENFKDARTFNPWRWQRSDENGVFTPFGGGPRLCPGYELARVEISFFLHHLVTRFSWEVAEQDKLVFFPTTRTIKGYPIIVQPRKASW